MVGRTQRFARSPGQPLFGDLSELPQTLLFCGSADILVADARRLAAAPGKI